MAQRHHPLRARRPFVTVTALLLLVVGLAGCAQPDDPLCPDRPDPALGRPAVDLKPMAPDGRDTDGDGIADRREPDYGTDPCLADTDDDGLTDLEEVWWATDPLRADTDGDGKADSLEVADRTFMWIEEDLRRADQDADGLPDSVEEHVFGTDPQLYSMDGDAYPDGVEIFGGMHASYAAKIREKNPGVQTDYPAGLSRSPFLADVVEIVVEVTQPGLILQKTIRMEHSTLQGSATRHVMNSDFGVTERAASGASGSTTDTTTDTTSTSNSRSSSTGTSTSRGTTNTDTNTESFSDTVTLKQEVGASASLSGISLEASASASHENTWVHGSSSTSETTTSSGQTSSTTSTTTTDNTKARTMAATYEQKWNTETEQASTFSIGSEFAGYSQEEWRTVEETDLSEAEFWSALYIHNVGNDILTAGFRDIAVNFYIGNDRDAWTTWTMSKSECGPTSAYGNLAGGASVHFANVCFKVTADVLKRIFSGEPVRAVLNHVDFGDAQVSTLDAQARALRIDVDYGDDLRRYTVAIPASGMTLPEAFGLAGGQMKTAMLGEQLVVSSVNGRDLSWDPEIGHSTLWTAYATLRNAPQNGDDRNRMFEDPAADGERPLGLAGLTLYPGDHVALRYEVHSDDDRLSDRQETLLGTSSSKADTDADGLTDLEEVTIGTNPLLADTNGNGATDREDIEAGNNPFPVPRSRHEIFSWFGSWDDKGVQTFRCRVISPTDASLLRDDECPDLNLDTWAWATVGQYQKGRPWMVGTLTAETARDWNWCHLTTLQGVVVRERYCGSGPNFISHAYDAPLASGRFLSGDRDALLVLAPEGDGTHKCWLVPAEGELHGLSCDLGASDHTRAFAVDVDGNGLDEIGIIRGKPDGGRCDIYDPRSAERVRDALPCDFQSGWTVASGDVLGDASDEIVVADPNSLRCTIYDAHGVRQRTIDACLSDPNDQIAIGHLDPTNGKEELVVAHMPEINSDMTTKRMGTCAIWNLATGSTAKPMSQVDGCRGQGFIYVGDFA